MTTNTGRGKRRGAEAEIWGVEHARSVHGLLAEHIRKAGADDQGDFYVSLDRADRPIVVVESKARRNLNIRGALKEAEREAINFSQARNLPYIPRAYVLVRPYGMGRKSIGEWPIYQTFDQLLTCG